MKTLLQSITDFQSGIYAKGSPEADLLYLQVSDFDASGSFKHLAVPTLQMEDRLAKHLLQPNDILFAAKGSNNFAAIYEESFGPAIASSSFIVLRIHKKQRTIADPAFVAWYLNNPVVLEGLKRNAAGSSMPAITMQQLSALEIHVPPMQKQQLILQLHELHLKEQSLLQQLASLKATFIHQQLFNTIN